MQYGQLRALRVCMAPPIMASATSERVASANLGSNLGCKPLLFSRKLDHPMSHRFAT